MVFMQPTVMACGLLPGAVTLAYPFLPRLPPATTTTIPAFQAASTAWQSGSWVQLIGRLKDGVGRSPAASVQSASRHAELRAALRVAAKRINEFNLGRRDDAALALLSRVLAREDSALVLPPCRARRMLYC
jgi:hypothetical protein